MQIQAFAKKLGRVDFTLGFVLEVIGCHRSQHQAIGRTDFLKQRRRHGRAKLLQTLMTGDIVKQLEPQPKTPGRSIQDLNCGQHGFGTNTVAWQYNYLHEFFLSLGIRPAG